MFEAVVAIVAVVAGMIASVVGFGIGSLLTPTLAYSMDMKIAVAAVSVPHFFATAYRLWIVRANVDKAVFKGFGIASAAGSFIGAMLGGQTAGSSLSLVLAGLLLFVGFGGLTGWIDNMRFGGASRYLAGLASGVFGGMVGNQGGVRSAALLGFELDKRAFVATATASGVIVDLVRMPVYVTAYRTEIVPHLPIVGIATVGCLAGTVVGARVLARVPQASFRRIICGVLVVTAMFVIVRFVLGA